MNKRVTAVLAVLLSTALPAAAQSFTSEDIGAPATAGASSGTFPSFTVTGAGTDIWDQSDQFRFVHTPATGDVEMIAQVSSQTNTDGFAKAGLMFRASTAANARHAFLCVTPSNGVLFQSRRSDGAISLFSVGTASAAPRWLRMVLHGNTLKGYESANGTAWTLVGVESVDLPGTARIGLAVTSHNAGAASTAVFANLAITANPAAAQVETPVYGPGTGAGLSGAYFASAFTTPGPPAAFPASATLVRTEATVDFTDAVPTIWPALPGNSADTFMVRWTGYIVPQFTGTYIFRVLGDDGYRLSIGGTLIIDNWSVHPPTPRVGTAALTAGQPYAIALDYFEDVGGAEIRLGWTLEGSGSIELGPIPATQSFTSLPPVGGGGILLGGGAPPAGLGGRDNDNGDAGCFGRAAAGRFPVSLLLVLSLLTFGSWRRR